MKLKNNLPPKFRFTRTVFAIIMIGAMFFEWGKYAVAILGVLFLISAATGFCITCKLYEKVFGCKECKIKK
jgi:hypothetical protein